MDTVGPVGILPQLLAALGVLFTTASVGDVIAKGVTGIIPDGSRFIAVIIYCLGMALFTIIMGNGFAAFSVITVGIGFPFLIMGLTRRWSVHCIGAYGRILRHLAYTYGSKLQYHAGSAAGDKR